MEQLDEEHANLEYVRNKAEISALEAKVDMFVIFPVKSSSIYYLVVSVKCWGEITFLHFTRRRF